MRNSSISRQIGRLFQMSITRSEKNEDLAVLEQYRLKILGYMNDLW